MQTDRKALSSNYSYNLVLRSAVFLIAFLPTLLLATPVAAKQPTGELVVSAESYPYVRVNGKKQTLLIGSSAGSLQQIRKGELQLLGSSAFVTQVFSKAYFPPHCSFEAEVSLQEAYSASSNITLALVAGRKAGHAWKYYLSLIPAAKNGVRIELRRYDSTKKFTVLKQSEKVYSCGDMLKLSFKRLGNSVHVRAGDEEWRFDNEPPISEARIRLSAYAAYGSFASVTAAEPDGTPLLSESFAIPEASTGNWDGPMGCKETELFAGNSVHMYTALAADMRFDWIGEGQFNWGYLDRYMKCLLAFDPDAHLLLRINLSTPGWWGALHPEHVAVAENRDTGKRMANKHDAACFASELWRKDIDNALRECIGHIRESDYASRIVGLTLMCGHAGEWNYGFEGNFHDFSIANTRAFGLWLRKKYETEEALRLAWSDVKVSFDTVCVPSRAEREQAELGQFYDPASQRNLIDYRRFHSESVADSLTGLARAAKEASDNRLFLTAFYGYHFPSGSNYHDLGHDALSIALQSPYLDSLCCPHDYTVRGSGQVTSINLPAKSIELHGKVWFNEDDSRTHLLSGETRYGCTKTPWQTANVLKRNLLHALQRHSCIWHLDWERGWFNEESIQNTIGQEQKLLRSLRPQDLQPVTEVAVVISERSKDFMLGSNEEGLRILLYRYAYHHQISRIGTPYDVILLRDLPRAPKYKFYIMLDVFYADEDERGILHDTACSNGSTVLWLYGAGCLTDTGFSLSAMEELTGIPVAVSRENGLLRVSMKGAESFDSPISIAPVFSAKKGGGRILGSLSRIDSAGKAQKIGGGFAARDFDGWKSLWCALPNLPAASLRKLLKDAGVHVYNNQGAFVTATGGLLSLHVPQDGNYRIVLPRAATLKDAFSGKFVSSKTRRLVLPMKKGETRTLRLN